MGVTKSNAMNITMLLTSIFKAVSCNLTLTVSIKKRVA